MCRIFGLVEPGLDPAAGRATGARMLAALDHGGPDSAHLHVEEGLVLGSTRLAISDPEGGLQPYRGGDLLAFFNGELYNGIPARAAFPAVEWSTTCDGEVLPHVVARHGHAAHGELDGMYAAATWDTRRRCLTLLRDPAGIKPLYYFAEGGRFGFASEIPALVALRGTGARPRMDAIRRYLRFRAVYGVDTPQGWPTAVEGIWSVPPGATLRVQADATVELLAPASGPALAPGDDRSLADRLADVVAEAVAATTIADVPYCSVLSGGLDSSIVTALAAQRTHGPLTTFTIVPVRQSRFDESVFAREVSQRYGTIHHEVPVDHRDLPQRLPAVVERLGQPNADPITASTHVLFEAIAAAGFKVALTGDGSDEVFGGYARFLAAHRGGPLDAYLDNVAGVPDAWCADLLGDAFDGADHRDTAVDGSAFARQYERAPLQTVMDFELAHRLPVYHLQRVDHLSAAHAVEARVPFCQPAVRAIGALLPMDERIAASGRVKKALTEVAAVRGWVPEQVARRPKQPFTFSLSEHLFHDGGRLFDWAREVVLDPAAVRRGLLRTAAVEKLFARADERRTEPLAQAVWALLVLELWLDRASRW